MSKYHESVIVIDLIFLIYPKPRANILLEFWQWGALAEVTSGLTYKNMSSKEEIHINFEIVWNAWRKKNLSPEVSHGKETLADRGRMDQLPAKYFVRTSFNTYRSAWAARRPWKTLERWWNNTVKGSKDVESITLAVSYCRHFVERMLVIKKKTLTSLPSLPFSPAGPRGPSGPVAPGGPWTDLSGWERRLSVNEWGR